jgi:Mg/Co/Ni transporter MgtE
MAVRDLMRSDQVTVPANLSLPQLLDRFISARRNHLYVVDDQGLFQGVIRIHDVNRASCEQVDAQSVLAGDLANRHFQTALPSELLENVLV